MHSLDSAERSLIGSGERVAAVAGFRNSISRIAKGNNLILRFTGMKISIIHLIINVLPIIQPGPVVLICAVR